MKRRIKGFIVIVERPLPRPFAHAMGGPFETLPEAQEWVEQKVQSRDEYVIFGVVPLTKRLTKRVKS